MKVSVIIPTWRRHELLEKSLISLCQQDEKPEQVLVVYRDIDSESYDVAKKFEDKLPIDLIEVSIPGVVHAENAGIEKVTGDITCFLDDDAQAPKEWIKIIKENFNDQMIIGVGGPDKIVHHHDQSYRKTVEQVGVITWYGKVIGNHHHLTKSKKVVSVLKGVNMAFRTNKLPFLDTKLQSEHSKGNGSHWELDLCMRILKSNKMKLIFDPRLDVIHESHHGHFINKDNTINNARNLVYVMLKNLSFFRKLSFLGYVIFVGNTQILGFGKIGYELLIKFNFSCLRQYFYSLIGIFKGLRLYLF